MSRLPHQSPASRDRLASRSRREFLKTSTLVAGGLAAGGGLDLARSAHAAGSDQLKVALVGCGGRGTGAAADALGVPDDLKLIAVADTFEDRARHAREQLIKKFPQKVDVPEDRIFTGFDAYQKAIAAGPDLVIIATPPGFRPVQYKAAVDAGKHVFMEKPCCTDAPGYRLMLEANAIADAKGLKVGVGLQRHHEARYIETVKRIQDGAVGKAMFLRVYWNMGNIWTKPRLPGDTEMAYQVRNWQYFCYFGGDHIVEQHVHNLDVANWVLGDHPISANGMGGRQRRDEFKDMGHIYDHHFVEFTYKDGTRLFSQCRQMPNCWNQVSEWVHGTQGTADCSGMIEAAGQPKWQFKGPKVSPYQQEHIDLVKAIRTNQKYNEGWHGAHSTMTAVLGRMATYSGQEITWDDAVNKGPALMPQTLAWDARPPITPDADGSYRSHVAMPGVTKAF